MSGLAVLFRRGREPVDPALVSAMLAAIPYRAVDGSRVQTFDDNTIALGASRFVTTMEAASEHQPLVSPRTRCAIVADVRLDNRHQLLDRLPDQPVPSWTDTEIILRGYEAWGPDAVPRLLGDFAFALWDPRLQRLVCARDTSGQRSLFYRITPDCFAAASEIQQLFQDPTVPVVPSEERIRDFLVPLNVYRNEKDRATTFYEGIHVLPAGHLLTVDREDARVRRYWELRPPAELRYRCDDDYAEHFRDLLFEIVRPRLRSAQPIGALLSGGLDSSSIVCVAQEIYRAGRAEDRGFTSYSSVFTGLPCDETEYIRAIPAKYGFRARYVKSTELTSSLELEPRGFMSTPGKGVSELLGILRIAVQDGVRTLLSGEVADSCVAGSPLVFDSLLRHGLLQEFWSQLRTYHRQSGESWQKILAVYCALPLLPLPLQRLGMVAYTEQFFARHRQHLLPFWLPGELRDDLARRHLALLLDEERGRRFASPARQFEYTLLDPPEAGFSTAGWPVQISRPFADRRLHEFLLAIPPEQKFRPLPHSDDAYAGSKQIVRRALRGILPERIRTRTGKTNFGSLVQDEIQRNWSAYEAAFGPTRQSECAAHGYVDPDAFWLRLIALREGHWGDDFIYVVRVLWLETWLRTFRLPRTELVTVADPRPEWIVQTLAREGRT